MVTSARTSSIDDHFSDDLPLAVAAVGCGVGEGGGGAHMTCVPRRHPGHHSCLGLAVAPQAAATLGSAAAPNVAATLGP